jgi:hypothetical protein
MSINVAPEETFGDFVSDANAEQVAARDGGRHLGVARHEGQAGGPGT